MKQALQESMRNLSRFWLDFCFIWEGFSTYFGSQRASETNQNSDRGLERPLEASGVAFGRPLSRIGASGGQNCPKKLWDRRNARGPSVSRDLDRIRHAHSVTPSSPEGGRRILPRDPAHSAKPAPKISGPPLFDLQKPSKISLDF